MCESWQYPALLKHLASRTNANTLHFLWQMERKSWKNHCPWITHCQQQKLNARAKYPVKQVLLVPPGFLPFQNLPCHCRYHSFRTCCNSGGWFAISSPLFCSLFNMFTANPVAWSLLALQLVVTLTPWSPANAEEASRQGFTKAVSRGSAFRAYLNYDNKDFHPIEIVESL